MKAVAYCRIAPEEEASLNAYAIEVQKSDIEAYSKDHDIEIVEYLVDHAGTGIKEPRPELDRILGGMLEEGVAALAAHWPRPMRLSTAGLACWSEMCRCGQSMRQAVRVSRPRRSNCEGSRELIRKRARSANSGARCPSRKRSRSQKSP